MTATQVKKLLSPVIDFSALSPTQAYVETLPPKIKQSIQDHQALVGMSKDMVIDALGRPPKRIRENDGNLDYEEWIFGEPPGDVQFVRFVNEEVVRVEHIQVGGEKVVKTAREVKVNPVTGAATVVDASAPQTASATAPADAAPTTATKKPAPKPPTLLHPGEQAEMQQGKPIGKDSGELGSKPIPAPGQEQPEWGTKPASTSPNASPDPNAPVPGPGQLPPVNPRG
jgi:hypothetical protein